MKLIAVRHGETEWNVVGREMGQLDSPLTERGIRQAEALANRLCGLRLSALYSSDLGRAMRTAEIISSATGVPATIDAGLRERHMGIFQGLTKNEAAEQFPAEYSNYQRVGHAYRIPDGESAEQRLERSVRVLTAIAQRHTDEAVVVVTHGGFLMGFFEYVLGMSPGNGWRFKRKNAAYNCFQYSDGRWSLETWNETSHLQRAEFMNDPAAEDVTE